MIVSATRRRREIKMPLCLSPHGAEKLSNNHEPTQKYDFSVSNQKYYFQANLAQKIKTVSLKEKQNSFKNWPLNLWWISNKTIMEVGNITKAATFPSFLHLSYKNTTLLFWDSAI